MNPYIQFALCFICVSCSTTTHHYTDLKKGDIGYQQKELYLSQALKCVNVEYPDVNLKGFGQPSVSRRNDWRRLTDHEQIHVSWIKFIHDENEAKRSNPVPMEDVSVSLSRSGNILDHNHSITEAWVQWAPKKLAEQVGPHRQLAAP